MNVPCGDVESCNGSFKDFKSYQRLIEGYFVARFVDAHKAESAALLDLAVDDAIACGDVDVACFIKTGLVDFERDDLASKPVYRSAPVQSDTN